MKIGAKEINKILKLIHKRYTFNIKPSINK